METTVKAEWRNGCVYVTRTIVDLEAPFTKWDLLSADEKKSYENIPFTANGTGECSQCKEPLDTEADFAKHFFISDLRYLNLGDCRNARMATYQGEV